MENFTIGKLAASAGVHVETVRYYERRGLLEQPTRTASGYRQYSAADLWRLQFIARGKAMGFTLAEIAELMGRDGAQPAVAIRLAAERKITQVDAQVRQLGAMRRRLELLAERCGADDPTDCAALRVLS